MSVTANVPAKQPNLLEFIDIGKAPSLWILALKTPHHMLRL
jgi:hypothetical protein